MVDTVALWGLEIASLDLSATLDEVDRLIDERRPRFLITANLNYVMLTHRHSSLRAANAAAAFIVADGMPLVWAARLKGCPLPERVTGADLLPALCARAAVRKHRIFFLGGAPGVAEACAARLEARFPGLKVAGTAAPDLGSLSPEQHDALLERISETRPDLLFAALGQPKGELWLAANVERIGVPVAVQIGAALDFGAGRKRRAPRWIQKLGLEWVHRMVDEPLRLGPRYLQNILFLLRRPPGTPFES